MSKILRKKVIIDESIVSDKYTHGDNLVTFWAYNDDGKKDEPERIYVPQDIDKEFPNSCASRGRGDNGAWCFSDVPGGFARSKKGDNPLNRIYYPVEEDRSQPELTPEEKRRFIEVCREYGMFPKYLNVDDCLNHPSQPDIPVFVFKAEDENTGEPINLSLMYVYLCCARYFREDTGFIRGFVHLLDEIKMDFHAAFILATRVCQDYTVHHFITCIRRYGSCHNANGVNDVPLHQIIGLKWFMKDPFAFDKYTIYNNGGSFRTMDKIAAKSKVELNCTAQMLMDPILVEAMHADTDNAAVKKVAEWEAIKNNIEYVDKLEEEAPKDEPDYCWNRVIVGPKVRRREKKAAGPVRDKNGRFIKRTAGGM